MTRTVKRKPITQAMQLALWKIWGAVPCAVCGAMCASSAFKAGNVTFRPFGWDHHLALVDGGEHTVENLRPACIVCHREKSAIEHKNNAKAKRISKKRTQPKKPSLLKSRGFDARYSKKFDGRVVRKTGAA